MPPHNEIEFASLIHRAVPQPVNESAEDCVVTAAVIPNIDHQSPGVIC